MLKKAVQQGRSERRSEAYFGPYVEPLSDARTTLADFFSILLEPIIEQEERRPVGRMPVERILDQLQLRALQRDCF